MTCLVLDFGKQNRLALERRCPRQPVALRLHANDFGMRVLGYLPDQRLPIGFRHPVLGLYFLLGINAPLKRALHFLRLRGDVLIFARLIQALCVHALGSAVCIVNVSRLFQVFNVICITSSAAAAACLLQLSDHGTA